MTEQGEEPGSRRLWFQALAFVVLFPAIAFGVGYAVEAKYTSDLIGAIEQDQGRSLTPAERATVDLPQICADPEIASDPVCGDLAIATLTRWLAIVTAILGLGILAVVAVVGQRVRHDRDALIRWFVPGLYVVLAGLALLVLVDGILTLAVAYLVFAVFIGSIYPVVLLLIVIGVLLGVVGILRAILGARRRALSHATARRLDEAASGPALMALVGDVATGLGVAPPDHVLVGLDPSFYVTEADVETTDGRWSGRTMYLSLPLMRILTVPELRAILGHELGHFRGEDTAFSQRFYPVYRGAGTAIDGLASAGGGNIVRLVALLPSLWILRLFIDAFVSAERRVSRERELIADQAGVDAASREDIGTSLVKLFAFTPQWDPTMEALIAAAGGGGSLPNAGDRFVELVRSSAAPSSLDGLDEREIPHPTDSHPPLSQRLTAIGLEIEGLRAGALDVAPREPADTLVADRSRIEESLTAWVEERIARMMAASAAGRPRR